MQNLSTLFAGGNFGIEFRTDFNEFLPYTPGKVYHGYIKPTPPEKSNEAALNYLLFDFVFFDDNGEQTEDSVHIDDIKKAYYLA